MASLPQQSPQPYIVQECINNTKSKFYTYKKITYNNGAVRYYYKGKNIHVKKEITTRKKDIVGYDKDNPILLLSYYFPDWFEAGVKTKTYETDYYGNNPENINGLKGFYFWNKKRGDKIKRILKWDCQDKEPPFTELIVEGTVVDFNTNEVLKGVRVSFRKEFDITNSKGMFKIPISVPKVKELTKVLTVGFTKEKYLINAISPYKGNGDIKSHLGVITLKPIPEIKLPQFHLSTSQIEILTLPEKDAKYFTKEKIIEILKEVLNRLLPIIASMLLEFGMKLLKENFDEMKEKVACPSKDKLDEIINKKNRLVKQLNNLMKSIDAALKFLGITEGILIFADSALKAVNATPVPTPPIVPFTAQQIETIIEVSKETVSLTNSLLTILQSVLNQVLTPLNQLDILIQQCYPEADQAQLSEELKEISQQLISQDASPIIKIINGFTMDIETEKTEKPLKRKRAIAKNPSGVTILKGEWSFSSVDQILINELVFYIQTNDLKAD